MQLTIDTAAGVASGFTEEKLSGEDYTWGNAMQDSGRSAGASFVSGVGSGNGSHTGSYSGSGSYFVSHLGENVDSAMAMVEYAEDRE